jgi:hypothetical protein
MKKRLSLTGTDLFLISLEKTRSRLASGTYRLRLYGEKA